MSNGHSARSGVIPTGMLAVIAHGRSLMAVEAVEAIEAVNVVDAVDGITVMLGLVRHVVIVAGAGDVTALVVLLARREFRIDVRPRVHEKRTHFSFFFFRWMRVSNKTKNWESTAINEFCIYIFFKFFFLRIRHRHTRFHTLTHCNTHTFGGFCTGSVSICQ